ncbi:MAG: glycosyltransferase family 39 protein [bacterium]|nr:glycosyltransferase family 39 protein [bacterium]
MKKILFLLLVIPLLAIPRFWQLGSLPSILNRDEAALAYNGYLLSSVGQDEWGRPWPVSLESFGDFKLIGYSAVLAALFKIVPLNDFWVRIPSALSGIGLLVVGYWFARTLKLRNQAAVFLAAMLAIAPVFIFYSRIAFEANVALLFFVLSLTTLLSDVLRPTLLKKLVILAAYAAAVFTYNSPLLLGILLLPIIIFVHGYKYWRKWTPVFSGWLLLTLLALALLQPVFEQKQNITLFSDEQASLAFNEYRSALPTGLQKVLGNKVIFFAPEVVANAVRAFSPRFLITEGGSHPWHSVPDWGHIYWWQYLLALIGVVLAVATILKQRIDWSQPWKSHQGRMFVLLLLLGISLLPSSITTDAPHTTRSLFFFFLLITSAGVAYESISKRVGKHFWLLISVLGLLSLFRYSQNYFVEYKSDQLMFQPGFEQAMIQVKQEFPDAEVAVVDGGGYQYILAAWYAQLSPSEYFSSVVRQAPNQIGFRYGQQAGRFHFIAQAADRTAEETVLVEWNGSGWEITKF